MILQAEGVYMRKLKDIPKHMRTKLWIESEIRHEEHMGIHTYHQCECDRGMCRSMMCAECWRELLARKRKKIEKKCLFSNKDTMLGCW